MALAAACVELWGGGGLAAAWKCVCPWVVSCNADTSSTHCIPVQTACTNCCYLHVQAETLATLLTGTHLGDVLVTAAGPQAWGLLAAAIMIPTVLLADLAALSLLGAVGVLAAVAVGLVVSDTAGSQ